MSGLLYILIFGIGSMFGMLAISIVLALPVQLAGERINSLIRPIQMGAGVVSCAFGVYIAAGIFCICCSRSCQTSERPRRFGTACSPRNFSNLPSAMLATS